MDNKNEPDKKEWDQMLNESFYPIKIKDVLNPLTYTFMQKICFFLVVFVSIALFFFGNRTTTFLSTEINTGKKESLKVLENKPEDSLDKEALLQKVHSKLIFKVIKKLPPPPEKKYVPKGPGIQEKINNFILLGVLIEEPMQAMIESRTTHETFCVKAGDMIIDVKVISVENGKVTLSYNEETGVLR